MNDETRDELMKRTREWLQSCVNAATRSGVPEEADLEAFILAHIDAEPARQAAAVAEAREEQREADVRSCPTCKGDGFTMRVRECPFCDDSTLDHECPTDEVKVHCLCGAARIRATPLTATPLKDQNKALRERVKELEAVAAQAHNIRAALGEFEGMPLLDGVGALQSALADCRSIVTGFARSSAKAEARVRELEQRILDSCPSPDEGGRLHAGGRIVCGQCHDSEVSHLRAQIAEAVLVLKGLVSKPNHTSQSGVDYGLACGRYYLSVAGHVVAMEGDVSRDPAPEPRWTQEAIRAVVDEFEAPVLDFLIKVEP